MARDIDGNKWNTLLRRQKVELGATSVDLWLAWGLVSLVKGDQLWTNKIVTTSKFSWDVDRKKAVGSNDLLSAPGAADRIITLVKDLEPALTVTDVGLWRINTLHVDSARSLVAWVESARLGVVWVDAPNESQTGANESRADTVDADGAINICDMLVAC